MKEQAKKIYYSWDVEGEAKDTIVVRSTDPAFPIVGKFKFNPKENKGKGCAVPAMVKAEALIEDLRTGKVSPKAIQ